MLRARGGIHNKRRRHARSLLPARPRSASSSSTIRPVTESLRVSSVSSRLNPARPRVHEWNPMASTTSDGSEQESPNPSEQNGDGSESGLRAADPEPAVKMDGAETDEKLNGHESTEQSPEEATRADGGNDEDGETEAEPEKEQQKSPGSADGTAERMKREQREEENASSPAEKNSNGGGGMKRRASLEMMSSSSDGEPLSRMDSEDRCVNRPPDSPIFTSVV